MARAIYEKAIYKREKQMDRAVYKNHKRNVIPTDGDEPVPPVKVTKYKVISAQASGTMMGYASEEQIIIPGKEPAVLSIVANVDGEIESLEVLEQGLFDEDIAGELSSYEYEGHGEGGIIIVETEPVEVEE